MIFTCVTISPEGTLSCLTTVKPLLLVADRISFIADLILQIQTETTNRFGIVFYGKNKRHKYIHQVTYAKFVHAFVISNQPELIGDWATVAA